MVTTDDEETLESLVNHPGWVLVKHHVLAEAIAKVEVETERVLESGGTNDVLVRDLLVARGKRQAVEWALRWPTEQLQRLKRLHPASEQAMLTRRGSL